MIEEKSFIQISDVTAERLDKRENTYKRVEFTALAGLMFNPSVGKNMPVIDYDAKPVSMNQYEESYLDGKEEILFNAAIGTILPGKIIKKTVPAYPIPDSETGEMKDVTSRRLVVFGDTTDKATFEANVIKTFADNGHDLTPVAPEVQLQDNIILEEEPTEVPAES